MAKGQNVCVRRVRPRQSCRGPVDDVADRDLLERFVATADEGAFALLVRRHGPRVMSICRRVLGDEHAAEDMFQATFWLLARKAAVVSWEESVGKWLGAAARRLALHSRAGRARRRCRELDTVRREFSSEGDPVREVARRELRWLLDRELHRLPEKYRAPVVLCYLEGKSNAQAAKELGWPMGSMSRRLARARALLFDRLNGRGAALWIGLLGVLLVVGALVNGRPAPQPGQDLGGALGRFAPRHGQDFEETLRHVIEGRRAERSVEPEQLVALAQQAADVATLIQNHDPGTNRPSWQRHVQELRRSALELAETARETERPHAVAAARKLLASCNHCHETFR